MTLDLKALKDAFMNTMISFADGRISAVEFEAQYSELWKAHRDSDTLYELNKAFIGIFDSMFTTLDCFCSEPDLRDDDDLDEQQLLSFVRDALGKLDKL